MNDSNLIETLEDNKSYIDALTENINEIRTNEFDKSECIITKINQFFQSVEQNQPKAHLFVDEAEYESKKYPYIHHGGKKDGKFKSKRHRDEFESKYHWSPKDTLEDWWSAVLPEIDLRIADAQNKIKNYSNLSETPHQQQIISPFAGEIKDMHPDEGRKFDITMYEFLEWYHNKEKETILAFVNGVFTINEDEIVKNNLKTEIGKMILDSGSKMENMKIEARKIVNQDKIKK